MVSDLNTLLIKGVKWTNFALLAGFFLSVLLSASVERCYVSRMLDFFYLNIEKADILTEDPYNYF